MDDINGITINKILTNGVTFDDSNFLGPVNEAFDEDDDFSEDGCIKPDICDPIGNYNKEPFSILWQKMQSIEPDDLIRKITVKKGICETVQSRSTVKIMFCIYFDGESKPYSSTKKFSPYVLCLEDSGLLPGVEMAIRSMSIGEHSRFLIHHSLMYGELGCPPYIPKNAMCLLHCIVMSTSEKDVTTETNISGDGNVMKDAFKRVKLLFEKGVRLYKSGDYTLAQSSFNKSLIQLQECRLADESEEKLQNDFLLKIYLNLAICYNKMNMPLKACSMCNEYNKICTVWNNWKILFQNAKALIMIGEFVESRKKLNRAKKLNPHSDEIENCIKMLNAKETVWQKYQVELSKFIDGEVKNDETLERFGNEVKLLCMSLKTDTELNSFIINLPSKLSCDELQLIKEIVKKEKFSFELKENDVQDSISITISKA